MNSWRYHMIALIGAVLIFQGCSGDENERLKSQMSENQALVSTVKSELAQARDQLSQQETLNRQLYGELESFRRKVTELEEAAAKARAEKPEPAPAPRPPVSGRDAVDQTKVSLMGAKALAEFKAAKLSERIDALSKDLNKKEKELAEIRQNAGNKDSEISSLRATVEKLQRGDAGRDTELNAKLESMSSELTERSSEAQRLKAELNDKAGLLDTLKEAVADAGRLKKTAEAEVARLQAEQRETATKLGQALNEADQFRQEIGRLQNQGEQSRQDIASLQGAVEQTRREKDHYHGEAVKLGLEVDRLRQDIQGLRATLDGTAKQLAASQNESEQAKEEIDRFREYGQQLAREQTRISGLLQQAQQDRTHYLEEATKLRLEVERRLQESQELRAQIADMGSRLKEFEQAAEAAERERPPGPSPLDQILDAPIKKGEAREKPSSLF